MKNIPQFKERIKYFLYGATLATGIIFTANYTRGPDYTYVFEKTLSGFSVSVNNIPFETFPSELTFNKVLQEKSLGITTISESLPTAYLTENSPISRLEIRIKK